MREIFMAFLLTSVIGTVLAIILTVLKPITRKVFSGTWHYYIWLVVLLVMIFPIKLTLPQENDILTNKEMINTYTEKPEERHTPITNTPLMVIDDTQEVAEVQSAYSKAAPMVEKITGYVNTFALAFSYVWIIVAVILLLFRILNYMLFVVKLHRNGEIISCPEIGAYTSRKIITRVSDKISSPLMMGVFRPTLLLPKTNLTPEQLHNILVHETTHLKRNDILYKWFVALVKCLCWYNPAIYLIGKQINIDCEIACDIAVVKKMNDREKKSYIETILSLLTYSKANPISLTTEMAGSKRVLKKRFAVIKKPFKIGRRAMIISIVSAAVILAVSVLASGVLNGKLFDIYKNETIQLNTDKRNGDVFNTLLIGVDEQGRADAIIVVMLTENDLTGLSVPRDTYFDGKRISEILSEENGDQKVIDTVRSEFSIPITYYAKVKIDMVKDLIDNNYGLYIDVPMDMKYDDPYNNLHIDLKKGDDQYLDGKGISDLLRYRRSNDGSGYPDGDLGRIKTGQQVVMKYLRDFEIIDVIANSGELIESINKNVITNYPIENYVNDKDIWANKNISFFTLPGATVFSREGRYVYEIDYGRLRNLLSYDAALQKNVGINNTPEDTIKNFFGHFAKSEFEAMKPYCTKKFVAKEFYNNRIHAMERATLDRIVTPLEKTETAKQLVVEVYVTIPGEKPEKQGDFIQANLHISLVRQPDGGYLIDEFVV